MAQIDNPTSEPSYEPDWRICPVVGGANDGDRLRCDVRRPHVTLREKIPLPPWEEIQRAMQHMSPVESRLHTYQRMELQAGDGGTYRGPGHSTFLYHDPDLKPWEVLRLLVERYRG